MKQFIKRGRIVLSGLFFIAIVGRLEARDAAANERHNRNMSFEASQRLRSSSEYINCVLTVDCDDRVCGIAGLPPGAYAEIRDRKTIKNNLKLLPALCGPFPVRRYIAEASQSFPARDRGPWIAMTFSPRHLAANEDKPFYVFSLFVYKYHGRYWLDGGGAKGGTAAVPAQSVCHFEHFLHSLTAHAFKRASQIEILHHYGD